VTLRPDIAGWSDNRFKRKELRFIGLRFQPGQREELAFLSLFLMSAF
jgi:hypothetical protein